jgi:DNA-binding NarL/FixJ family response regulator
MQSVLIVDDHPLFREAMRDVVGRLFAAKGWEATCSEAASFDEALAAMAQTPDLDLILLDLYMPGTRDLSGLLGLRAGAPATPIVVVSSLTDADTMRRAMLCGAAGFIPKASSKERMVDALQVVLAGGVYWPAECTQLRRESSAVAALTPRQAAVLARLVDGKSNKEIGRDLCISDMTVKVHVSAVLRSLGVVTRAQAIVAVRGERATSQSQT